MKFPDDLTNRVQQAIQASRRHGPARPVDTAAINDTIRQALSSAGLDANAGPMKGVTETIERALASAGLMQREMPPYDRGVTIDGTAHVVDTSVDTSVDPSADTPVDKPHERADRAPIEPARPGSFV